MAAAIVYFALFVGGIGAPVGDMLQKLTVGPFQTPKECYSAGALVINDLNAKHPGKDFRGACLANNPGFNADPRASLTLQELVTRALR